MRPVIGIIGAGKVGFTLARLWYEAGYAIGAICSRRIQAAIDLANFVRSEAASTPLEVALNCDLIVISVPDDEIQHVVTELSEGKLKAKGVIHVSGAKGTESLVEIGSGKVMIGSLHPIFPFANIERSMKELPGSVFAIEANHPRLQGWLMDLVQALHGQIIMIPEGEKAIYHAALVFVSNYCVILFSVAEQLIQSLAVDREITHQALYGLFQATARNLENNHTHQALTGPLVRGDLTTLDSHLQALLQFPDMAELYRLLALAGIPLLEQRGLSEEKIGYILQLLNQK